MGQTQLCAFRGDWQDTPSFLIDGRRGLASQRERTSPDRVFGASPSHVRRKFGLYFGLRQVGSGPQAQRSGG